ncbi:hypothetical protein [Phenylobacterium sp.]|uniref:hypothetical protein n=1 Tax=Phenylobacterium sp. TaxID=1871053 RepID=UPI00286A9C66|nr:hypothetical protein [Phenylobacterium sp.]
MAETSPIPAKKPSARARFSALPISDDHITRLSYRIYVDETGLETWRGHSLFGFAGVAGYGPEILRVDRAWKRLKRDHFGGEEARLHASRDVLTAEQQLAIDAFFSTTRLRRFAYICEAPPMALPGVDALKAMRGMLVKEVVDHISSLPKIPDDIAIVFETSERLSPQIMDIFPGLAFTVDAPDLPRPLKRQVVTAFTDKKVGVATLEMADQVAYQAQREHRRGIPIADPGPAFRSVFPDPRPPYAKFMLMRIASAAYADQGLTCTFEEPGMVGFRFEGEKGLAAANRWLARMPAEQAVKVFGLRPLPT